jgi:opacity protein-like surface antigen
VNGSVGFAYFATTSSVEGSNNDGDPFASDTNFDDATFAWTAGGGVQIRVAGGGKPVYLDFGARYHGNGEAEYLRKGDITDLPDGTVVLNPQRSDTNLWTIRVGVSVGISGVEGRD